MGAMVEFAAGLVALMIFSIPFAIAFRYRGVIKKWITDKESYKMWEKSDATRAERDIIKAQWRLDDAHAYAEWVKVKDARKEVEATNEKNTED